MGDLAESVKSQKSHCVLLASILSIRHQTFDQERWVGQRQIHSLYLWFTFSGDSVAFGRAVNTLSWYNWLMANQARYYAVSMEEK